MKKQFKNTDEYNIGEIIISAEEVEMRLEELVTLLASEFKNKNVLIVGLLTGAAWFTIDFLKLLHMHGVTDYELTFMKVSSYREGTTATYNPRIEYDISIDPKGRHVILIDDIVDTGKTLSAVTALLESKDIVSVKSIVLLDKPSRREVSYKPDHRGFEIPDIWVQGYGMDSDGYGRGDPHIRKGPYKY